MNNEVEFVDTDVEELVSKMVASYEKITGKTLYPADPEKQFILWIVGIIIQERVNINYAAQQNIPSYAEGKHLDALAELFHGIKREKACPAVTTMRFYISEAREDKFLIPFGTRITAGNITFETTQSVYLEGGKLSTDVKAQCQTVGTVGNGFLPGQIKTLVDIFPYYDRCENITESTGGTDTETDLEFRLRLRNSEDTYSTAGSIGAYTYYAKNAIDGISDIAVLSPSPGSVSVYVLMKNGKLPNQEELNAVTNAVSADDVRPLTDNVTVLVPETVDFSIDMTFYIPKRSNSSAADIEVAVNKAVDKYITWQTGKLGRDIIPSELIARVMATGVKRVDVRSPVYTVVDSTSKIAKLASRKVQSGGFEDE